MSLRTQLEKKIENKRQEIGELETKLREANAFLQGLQEALKILPKDGSEERGTEQNLRPGSHVAKARDALRQAGKPMYIADIVKAIGLEDNKRNRGSVAGSLGSYARKGEIFTALGNNNFGLIEIEVEGSEPPDDFGIDA
jgi:hypothetical protein